MVCKPQNVRVKRLIVRGGNAARVADFDPAVVPFRDELEQTLREVARVFRLAAAFPRARQRFLVAVTTEHVVAVIEYESKSSFCLQAPVIAQSLILNLNNPT